MLVLKIVSNEVLGGIIKVILILGGKVMPLDRLIEITSIIVTVGLVVWLVPKNKIKDATVIFLFKQTLTWILGLIVVEWNLIEYPTRFLANATKSSLTFEYLVYPGICVLFNLFYPEKTSTLRQLTHYVVYTSGISGFEAILEKYTNTIIYIHWTWYWTWITIFLTFLTSRFFYRWFRGDFSNTKVA
ncbi:CBO0543 family protein [Heliobacterium chlorum]|nr:CBO0543 family protein [Heliobacterium chlorum]